MKRWKLQDKEQPEFTQISQNNLIGSVDYDHFILETALFKEILTALVLQVGWLLL